MTRETDRPIMTFGQLCALNPDALRSVRCLLPCREFLRLVKALSGYAFTRRALQFYSSPQIRLMPLPVHRQGHTAHYLHPEHTLRLSAALHLRKRHFFPIKLIREVLEKLPPEFLGLVIRGILSADEVRNLALGDASAPFAEQMIFERRMRGFTGDMGGDFGLKSERAESALRAALTGFDDWMADEMSGPSDLEGLESWLVEPGDHFMSEEDSTAVSRMRCSGAPAKTGSGVPEMCRFDPLVGIGSVEPLCRQTGSQSAELGERIPTCRALLKRRSS